MLLPPFLDVVTYVAVVIWTRMFQDSGNSDTATETEWTFITPDKMYYDTGHVI
jgi:hypothetical protein